MWKLHRLPEGLSRFLRGATEDATLHIGDLEIADLQEWRSSRATPALRDHTESW